MRLGVVANVSGGAILRGVTRAAHVGDDGLMPGGTVSVLDSPTVPPAPLPRDGTDGKRHRVISSERRLKLREWGKQWGQVGSQWKQDQASRAG